MDEGGSLRSWRAATKSLRDMENRSAKRVSPIAERFLSRRLLDAYFQWAGRRFQPVAIRSLFRAQNLIVLLGDLIECGFGGLRPRGGGKVLILAGLEKLCVLGGVIEVF